MQSFFSKIPYSAQTWRHLIVAFALFLIPTFSFVAIADEVREQDTLGFDEAVLRGINSFSSPIFDVAAISLTQFGGPIGVVVLTAGAVTLLWGRQMKRRAAQLLCGVVGAELLNLILKSFFQRDRPQLWERLVTENSYSFPSGHAMASSSLALSLIVIMWPTRFRWPVFIGASLYMTVVALTRLYLGVHYPTDILAGWMVSAAWVSVVALVIRYHKRITILLSR